MKTYVVGTHEYRHYMYSSRNKKNITWIPPHICSYVFSYQAEPLPIKFNEMVSDFQLYLILEIFEAQSCQLRILESDLVHIV